MIKSLHITNFQSHKDTQLEFDPGVNIILGASDSGKTAIIRALRWLAFNRPQGDAFRSHWGGVCSVEAVFDDHIISRKKDKVDEYILDGESYKAFRTDIPEEIIKALDINDINLQMQLDSPFLLNDSPGTVAQHFNKVARLDKIDTGLQKVQSEIRSLTSEIKFKEKDIEKREEELLKFSHLEKMEIDIEAMQALYDMFLNITKTHSKLNSLISNITGKQEEIEEQSYLLPLESLVDDILQLQETKKQKETIATNLHNLALDVSQIDAELEHYQEIISMENQVVLILSWYNIIEEKEKERTKLQKVLTNISITQDEIEDNQIFIKEKEVVFKKEMPDVCPLCDTKL